MDESGIFTDPMMKGLGFKYIYIYIYTGLVPMGMDPFSNGCCLNPGRSTRYVEATGGRSLKR